MIKGLNLSRGTTGKGTVTRYTGLMPKGLRETVDSCSLNQSRPQVMTLDDESYINDLQPWPHRLQRLCVVTTATNRSLWNGSSVADSSHSVWGSALTSAAHRGRLFLTRGYYVWAAFYDEFEDENLLWLLYILVAISVCACSLCTYQCIALYNEDD